MSNRTYTKEELSAALASMGVTDQTDVSRYGSGHINDTFKVATKRGVRYILQRVNTDIFPPELLNGDVYFHTAYDDHNLVRCRTQLKMVESMEAQKDEYERIVRG